MSKSMDKILYFENMLTFKERGKRAFIINDINNWHICRTCLQTEFTDFSSTEVLVDGKVMSATDLLVDVTGTKVPSRSRPLRICECCFYTLQNFHSFKNKATRATTVFELLLNKLNKDDFSDISRNTDDSNYMFSPKESSEVMEDINQDICSEFMEEADKTDGDNVQRLVESKAHSFEMEQNESERVFEVYEFRPEFCSEGDVDGPVEEMTIALKVERLNEQIESDGQDSNQINFDASYEIIDSLEENCDVGAIKSEFYQYEIYNVASDVVHEERKHHLQKKKFKCKECGREFSHSQSLSRHVNSHKLKQNFMCEFCGKVFLRADDRRRHERVHTGERPYNCKICKKAFKQSGELKEHQLVHYKHKLFECEICGHKLSSRNGLYMHKKSHG